VTRALPQYSDVGQRIADTWPNVDRGSIVLEHVTTGRRELLHACPVHSYFAIVMVGSVAYRFGRTLTPGRTSAAAR
jgi:hypothetical protein